jgi:uncharacterized repeat protein (TIGR03803 family)
MNPMSFMKLGKNHILLLPILIASLNLIPAIPGAAQTFTNLHNFNGLDGSDPQAGLTISGSTLYGVADSGGSSSYGTVFAINVDGTGFTNLYSFSAPSGSPNYGTNSDGAYADGTLVLSGNTLYGTAFYGGTNGNGTVYAVNTNGTGFRTLHSFTATSGVNATNSDGVSPEAGLFLSGNTLYGTTEHGGSSGNGVVFKINTDGSGFTNLHSLNGTTDGKVPQRVLVSAGVVYGAAALGGTNGNGTVFAINTNGTGFTILHNFKAGTGAFPKATNIDGAFPVVGIISGNTLYGTTYSGGSSGNGTLFAINTNGTGFTNLYFFTATSGASLTNRDGANPGPASGLVISGNTLYGTANSGGSFSNGTVFAVNTNGTGFLTLYSFNALATDGFGNKTNNDGANPFVGLILSGNTLYGTATVGGSWSKGTVFALGLPLPVMGIAQSGNQIVLSWPTTATSFTLQSATNLIYGSWSNITSGVTTVGTNYTFTNPVTGNVSFFRLKQ